MNLKQIKFSSTPQPTYEVSYTQNIPNISSNPHDNPMPGRPVRVKSLNNCQVQFPASQEKAGVSIVGGIAYHVTNRSKKAPSSTISLGMRRGRAKTQMGEVANQYQDEILRAQTGKKSKEEIDLMQMMKKLEKQCGISPCEVQEIEIKQSEKYHIQKEMQKELIEKSRMGARSRQTKEAKDGVQVEVEKSSNAEMEKMFNQSIQDDFVVKNNITYQAYESPNQRHVPVRTRPDSAGLFQKVDIQFQAQTYAETQKNVVVNSQIPPTYPQRQYSINSSVGTPGSLYRYGKQSPKINAPAISEMQGIYLQRVSGTVPREMSSSVVYKDVDLIRSTFDDMQESPCFLTVRQNNLKSSDRRVSVSSTRRRSTVVEPFSFYQ